MVSLNLCTVLGAYLCTYTYVQYVYVRMYVFTYVRWWDAWMRDEGHEGCVDVPCSTVTHHGQPELPSRPKVEAL